MSKVLKPDFILSEFPSFDSKEEPISFPLKIEPGLPYAMRSPSIADHVQYMEKLLRRIVPRDLLSKTQGELIEQLPALLPFICWTNCLTPPDTLSIYLLCFASKEDHPDTTFLDLIKRWLIPEKKLSILSGHTLHFQWDLFPQKQFFLLEVKILVEDGKDLSFIEQNLPSLSQEIASSLREKKFSDYILKTRSLSSNEKVALIHKELIHLLQQTPSYLDGSIFVEMGRFLSLAPPEFFEPRPHRLISRIVISHHLMRLRLLRALNLSPENRHVNVRYVRTNLQFCFGSKPVLGLIVALSLFNKHDFFEEGHIVQAAQSLVPNVQGVKGSFYAHQGLQDPIRTAYIELEKKDGTSFSSEEIHVLKEELEEEVKRRIETLVPSIFMIRNEEEIMRNILILSQELKYLSDLPQVMISLDRQTASELFFTLIVVRLQKQHQTSLQKAFLTLSPSVRFLPDRVQQVGFLRKNYPKEANVFHLSLHKDPSLVRSDGSVNFYLARQKIAGLLFEAVGSFRDYNGGMILKQGELFSEFKTAFSSISQKHNELLENFFFSLNPIETQATLPLASLESLFTMLLEGMDVELSKKDHYFLKVEEKNESLFAVIKTQDASFKEDLSDALVRYDLSSKSLIHTYVNFQGSFFTGLIFQSPEPKKQTLLIEAVHHALLQWKTRLKNQQLLRLSFFDIPRSFDPRLGGDELSCTCLKMLFDGLTRMDSTGKPELALAESIEISSDLKKYVFTIRTSYWSNGVPITAYDFEYAWKKIISPHFSTPFMYFFYPIKNAKAANDSLCTLNEVGVKALDHRTLEVELEHPTPEFLELTAHTLYSPVSHVLDKVHPNWGMGGEDEFVCNGPFMIKKVTPNLRCELIKNPTYWDKDHVKLEQILISKDNSYIANQMFKNDETDWLGKPLRAWEPYFSENAEEPSSSTPMGIYWCVFNTESFPFNHRKLRQAFSYAINRHELVDDLSYDGLPASTPLPLSHTMNHDPREVVGNIEKAKQLFEEALQELSLTRETFPLVTLIHSNSTIRESSSAYIARQWQKLFNIPCQVVGYEFHVFLNKMMKGDFQLGTLFWKSWIDNPIYTLNAFKQSNHEVNFAKWHSEEYGKLLDQAQEEIDPLMRIKYLAEAERILIKEKPVFSIFYEKERNIKKPHLRNVYYSETTGYVDFKNSYIER